MNYTNSKLQKKIGKIRTLAVQLIDLEKFMELEIFKENDKIRIPVEEKMWEIIKELHKSTKNDSDI
jgi:hypothetical protein